MDWVGGKEKGGLRLLLSAAALLVCISADRKVSLRDMFLFELPPFTSPGLSGWGERGVDISLTSETAILVCMPADRESERAGRLFLLRIHRSISTDWLGKKREVSVSLNLSGGSLTTHTSGSGVRAHGTYCFLCIRHSIYTDWVRGEAEEVPTSPILSGSVFSNHTSGSGARTYNLFLSRLGPFRFCGAGGGD